MTDDVDDLSEDAAEFRCLVPFPDGSASFVNGFEAGMVWQRMVAGETPLENLVAYHQENLTVFERMADAQGYDMEAEAPSDGWVVVSFNKRPKRFRLIDGGMATNTPTPEAGSMTTSASADALEPGRPNK